MDKLSELYLAENEIDDISSLSNLPKLKRLHLRKNTLDKFKGIPNLPAIKYLNLRENKVTDIKEFEKLKALPTLEAFTALQNPCSDEIGEAFRKQIIMRLPHLSRFAKEPITNEEKKDALAEFEEMKKQEEEKKKQEEEEKKKELAKNKNAAPGSPHFLFFLLFLHFPTCP